jgi:hypothetical protein
MTLGFSVAANDGSPRTEFIPARTTPEQISTVKRLFIDNRDRHDPGNTSPFNFQVFFGNDPARSVGIAAYDNVASVELKAVAFPKIEGERYVIISIAELNDNMLDACSDGAHDAFAIVYFDSDSLTAGVVKPLKGTDFYQKQLFFNPTIPRLKSLSIKFLKHDGSVVTLADTGNESHVSLLLEISTKVNRIY